MIRFMSSHEEDLFVLREEKKKKWKIELYPGGMSELEKRASDYFHCKSDKRIKFPIHGDGLDEFVFQHLTDDLIPTKMVDGEQAQEFFHGFIDNVFLKANSELPWREFVEVNSEAPSHYGATSTREKTEVIHQLIEESPSLIGIESSCGEFFREVTFSNICGRMFFNYNEFLKYMMYDKEPKLMKLSGLVKPDLIYVEPNHTYIVETKLVGRGRAKLRFLEQAAIKQLTLAAHFIHSNFNLPFTLVGAYSRRDGRSMRYKHYCFDTSTKELHETRDSGVDSYLLGNQGG
jgi:hypothetical protein